jgi:hypothetical protein
MLNSDRLIDAYRKLVSLTAFLAITYCFLVFVNAYTPFSFAGSLRLLHSILAGRAFMLLTEMTIYSRFLRSLAKASGKPELAWLAPEPAAWAAAIIALVGTNVASLQQHEPVSWSIGAALLFVNWRQTTCNAFHATEQLVLNDEEQERLEELGRPKRTGRTGTSLAIFLASQLLLVLFALLTPPSVLVNPLSSAMVSLWWPLALAISVMYLLFAALSLSTNGTLWWVCLAMVILVEIVLILCVATIRTQATLTGPFLRI